MMRAYARALSCFGVALFGVLPSHAKEGATNAARPPVGQPAAALAEPPPSDLTEQAKQLYLLGAEAFTAQRNADAIYYFRQAERLVPNAKLSYNIALAYDEMGDTGRALREYRAFLAREPGSVHREEVQARVAKLELALVALGVQQLHIASEPPGATLHVGEELVGVTPWAGELTPGLHRIRLEHAGYQPHTAEVALSAQHAADVQVALRAQPADEAKKPAALSRVQPLSWCFLGVGVGAFAGGLGFELSRAASSDRASSAATPEAVARAQGAADAKQMASLLLLGAGGAFVVGGGVLLVLDLNRDRLPGGTAARGNTAASGRTTSAASVSVPCDRDFCGLVTQGRF